MDTRTRAVWLAVVAGALAAAFGPTAIGTVKEWQFRRQADAALADAEAESRTAVESAVAAVEARFAKAEAGAEAFAAEAMGWSAKWRLVVDAVPGTGGGGRRALLEAAFARHVLAAGELEGAAEAAAEALGCEEDAIDDRLALRLGRDLGAATPADAGGRAASATVTATLAETMALARKELARELAGDVASLAATVVVTELATPAAVEAAATAGLLTAGSVGAWETFGVSLAVGVAADLAIDAVRRRIDDPRGRLARRVRERIVAVRERLLDGPEGPEGGDGLKARLGRYGECRSALRRRAVLGAESP